MNKTLILVAAGAGILYFATKAKGADDGGGTLKGDVDGDGIITAHDVKMIGDYTVGKITLTPAQFARADVNCDGLVTVEDALFVAQYFAGTRGSLECQ